MRFTLAQVFRSLGFFAFGFWVATWPWTYPHMTKGAIFLVPLAIGGAIGALFGKTPHGVFGGLAFIAVMALVGLILLAVGGLPVD